MPVHLEARKESAVDNLSLLQDEWTYLTHAAFFMAENYSSPGEKENSQGLEKGIVTAHY